MNYGVFQKNSAWHYYVNIDTKNGKLRRITRKGGNTKQEALKTLKLILNQCNNDLQKINDDIKYIKFIDLWFEKFKSENYDMDLERFYEKLINNFIVPNLGLYELKTLSSFTIQSFINKIYIRRLPKTLIYGLSDILNTSLKSAISEYNYIKTNPMDDVTIPGSEENYEIGDQIKFITDNQYKKILNKFPKGTDYYVPINIAYYTGMKTSEVFALRWECVDLCRDFIRVENIISYKNKTWQLQPLKSKEYYRIIPLKNKLKEILIAHKDYQTKREKDLDYDSSFSEFICTRTTGKLITKRAAMDISKLINYELFIDMSFQSFRHSYAKKLINSNMDITRIQHRLGFKSLKYFFNLYYDKLDNKTKQKLINKYEDVFEITKLASLNPGKTGNYGGTK
ncbi:tyrosine-type recombinase/integrase [Clostridium sp. DL1XJH146]